MYAGRLYGAFPGRNIPEMAVALAAEEFGIWPDEMVARAVDDLQDFYDPPSLAQVREALRHAKAELAKENAKGRELAAEGTWTPEDEARSREVLGEVMAGWRKRQAEWNRELEPVGRFAVEAEEFSQRHKKQSRSHAPAPRCDGTGKEPVWNGAAWCCPDCMEPIEKSVPSTGGDRS